MTKLSKKPTPSIADKKERVRKAVRILGEALDNYKEAHPHWRIEVPDLFDPMERQVPQALPRGRPRQGNHLGAAVRGAALSGRVGLEGFANGR